MVAYIYIHIPSIYKYTHIYIYIYCQLLILQYTKHQGIYRPTHLFSMEVHHQSRRPFGSPVQDFCRLNQPFICVPGLGWEKPLQL